MVTIRCLAYNHEPYIRQCLEGFVMQKTNFRFEAIIHDDASTDGTTAIIREYAEKYPEIIKPIFQKENQYSKRDGTINRVINEHTHGKYVAICEGDDYWIDPFKLQKQVNFLENNPEYGLACSEINAYYQSSNLFVKNYFKHKKWNIKYDFDDFLINTWFLAPCTWLYKKEFLDNEISKNKFIVGDLPLLLEISYKSKVKFFKEPTAVYRIVNKSASHGFNYLQQQKFREGILHIQSYYIIKYNKRKLERKIISRWLIIMAKISFNYHRYKNMIHYLKNYIMHILHIRDLKVLN